jgi:hypothetical protein
MKLLFEQNTPLHLRVFCAKSSELLENKGVEFWLTAKNDKRVCIRLKTKRLVIAKQQSRSKMGRIGIHPAVSV